MVYEDAGGNHVQRSFRVVRTRPLVVRRDVARWTSGW
jgi:hypothetical protein